MNGGNGLPASFYADGFKPASQVRLRRKDKKGNYLKGILIGTDGESNTGKTEFILSAPGPGLVICLDRGYDAMLDNPAPPVTRRSDFAFQEVNAPLPTQAVQRDYLEYWRTFYDMYKKALANPDATTVGLDGDSDSWELQRLAEFGKLTQIPSIMYTNVNASRRAMIAKAADSGKVIIATNKITPEYVEEKDDKGNTVLDDKGKPRRKRSGGMVRQGFADQDYLWQIQLRHLYRAGQWGIRIMKCKANMGLEGEEMWGDDCNFASLVQTVYPSIPLEMWGY